MKYAELLEQVRDAITVRRVYGEPYESGGAVIIPAASVGGGGGGGGGSDADGNSGGEGAGFGVGAKPVGAYVLHDGRLTWHPAVDVNEIVATVGKVLIAGILAFALTRLRKRGA
ncbi:spore germination protein GerW family protein [Nocardia sp. NBC_00508]|uniref:spore germination protein GerW family protein n=1 Tax=Nocardia sp. NBC_00508 TaxID=2975992 RepID=UPI002E7FED7C|nr:sporulation protein [Nocardia sp. NBC_00508]WUD63562.1 spore germination protein GerW family protein [Nocardia sp. NBC_00508]